MSKQGHIRLNTTRHSLPAVVPRSIVLVRGLFVLGGVLSAGYVGLALMKLDAQVSGGELAAYTIGPALVAMTTMLPFAITVRRVRPWARSAMVAVCITLIAWSVALIAIDAAMHVGRLGSELAAGWLPVLHYATSTVILAAGIGGVIGLIGADAGEYFRRHQQLAEDDARLWPISQLRHLQAARVVGAPVGVGAVRSLHSTSPITPVSTPPAVGGPPAFETLRRAA
jgi:hypothetical protein